MARDPLAQEVHRMVRDAVRRVEIVKLYDDGDQQLVDVQGLDGEFLRGIVRAESFGESSNPPAGCDGLLVRIGGGANSGVVVGGDFPGARPKDLPVGCKAIYNQYGEIISLLQHEIRIKTRILTVECDIVDKKVTNLLVEGPQPDDRANVTIKGNITHDGDFTVGLPTSDPAVPGRLWLDVATRNVKVSAGP